MSAKTLAQVLIRVWGLILIVTAVAASGTLFMFTGGSQWRAAAASSVTNLVFSFIAGFFFVRDGDRIGAWLASDLEVEGEPTGPPADAKAILSIGLALLGAFYLVEGLRSGAVVALDLVIKPKEDYVNAVAYLWDRDNQAIARAVVDTIAGIILLFGKQNIAGSAARFWRVVRARDET